MKIIFFGTSSFATAHLLSLKNSEYKLVAVVTQPDKMSGRGLIRSFSPVKLIAQKYGLPLYQPQRVGSSDFIKELKSLKPDVFVVAAFGQILPKEVLRIPKRYSINIHPSLLPKYRGAAPINWALIKGEKITGLTIFRMEEKMDAGDIIVKKEINIDDGDTALSLSEKLSKLGADMLIQTLKLMEKGEVQLIPQNENEASYAPKLKKERGLIDWNRSSKEIHNHVRGMIPWPSAYTHLDNKLIKIWKTKLVQGVLADNVDAGTITKIDKEAIRVRTKDGVILICELQAGGGRKMSAEVYCRGHRIEIGQRFS